MRVSNSAAQKLFQLYEIGYGRFENMPQPQVVTLPALKRHSRGRHKLRQFQLLWQAQMPGHLSVQEEKQLEGEGGRHQGPLDFNSPWKLRSRLNKWKKTAGRCYLKSRPEAFTKHHSIETSSISCWKLRPHCKRANTTVPTHN